MKFKPTRIDNLFRFKKQTQATCTQIHLFCNTCTCVCAHVFMGKMWHTIFCFMPHSILVVPLNILAVMKRYKHCIYSVWVHFVLNVADNLFLFHVQFESYYLLLCSLFCMSISGWLVYKGNLMSSVCNLILLFTMYRYMYEIHVYCILY